MLSDLQINIFKAFWESYFFISTENGKKRKIFALLTDLLSHSHDYQRLFIYLKFSNKLFLCIRSPYQKSCCTLPIELVK